MNAAQTSLYFREWGQVRKHLVEQGIDPRQADAKRHELHAKALGRDKSSKAFTNADLDRVLAAFRAVYDGGNLTAQLRQEEQPDMRRAMARARIECLSFQVGAALGSESGYVRTIARSTFGTDQWHALPFERMKVIEGILRRRVSQRHSTEECEGIFAGADVAAEQRRETVAPHVAAKAAEMVGEGDEVPF